MPSSAPAAAAGPAGLRPVLVAPASARVVYVLAQAAGITGSSTPVLFRSGDTGRRFRLVGTPVVRWPLTGRPMSVSELWFVNPADGYALFGSWGQPRPLMVTSDGAKTWHQVTLGAGGFVSAIAGRGNRAYALVVRCARGGAVCRDVRLYRAVAGSRTWTLMRAAGIPRVNYAGGAPLAAWGNSVWLMAGDGQIGRPLLLRSADAGRSFHQAAAVPSLGCGLAATSPSVVWLSCSGGMQVTFDRWAAGRLRRLPVTGAGTGDTFLDPVSNRAAYFGTAVGHLAGRLYLSRDAGASFARTGRLPAGFAAGTTATMVFLTLRTGLSWHYGGVLRRTSNGGVTWTAIRL